MAWEYRYTSIGGLYRGELPLHEYPASQTVVTWGGTGYWKQIIGEEPTSSSSYQPSNEGWSRASYSYPSDIIVFASRDENGEITRYLRGYMPDANTFQWQDSEDGNTWNTLFNASGMSSYDWIILTERVVDDKDYIGLVFWRVDAAPYFTVSSGVLLDVAEWESDYGTIDKTEFSEEYGEASEADGYDGGTFDDSSDTIGVPAMPSIGVSSIGFVNVYNPSTGALAQLGEDLFPDFTPTTPYSPSGNTVIDAIIDVAEALANIATNIPNMIEMYNNAQLINYIIDCHIIPVTPTVGTSQSIKIGYRTMSQAAPKVTSDYVDCDCGTLNIGEYYRNFIDYGPYTQAKLFLPFVGFVPIEPELFQSGTLNVVYRFNVIDGSFMAFVLSTSSKSKLSNSVIGQWGGNACVHVPITGINYSNMVSGIAAGASAVVAEIGKGSLIGAADAALNTAAAAPALQSSNGYNATTSFLSVRTPYLVIERSVSHYPKDYGHEQGYPSEITADWSKLSGYTESDAIHLEGLGATDEETKEIASLLAAGVIL